MNDIFSKLRGIITQNAPIGAQSWFACGGSADILFQPADFEDLRGFVVLYCHPEQSEGSLIKSGDSSAMPQNDKKLTIIGGLANTIVRDGGIRGVTIQLGKPFADIKSIGDTYFEVGCGALNGSVAAAAVKAGIGGLEFLFGIPGSVGGALAMNAGAYGAEMKDVLVGVNGLTRAGEALRFTAADLRMSYRHSEIPDGVILTSCILKGVQEDYDTVKARITEIKARRNDTQPIREKTGGSTFANPSSPELQTAGLPDGTKAWQIVEMVGGRGLRRGGAMISEKHCNFMLNTGDATAADLEGLGNELISRAYEKFGIKLRWEIKRIGDLS
jgi:UDP-N-acetylmuramate dehydrogenase